MICCAKLLRISIQRMLKAISKIQIRTICLSECFFQKKQTAHVSALLPTNLSKFDYNKSRRQAALHLCAVCAVMLYLEVLVSPGPELVVEAIAYLAMALPLFRAITLPLLLFRAITLPPRPGAQTRALAAFAPRA